MTGTYFSFKKLVSDLQQFILYFQEMAVPLGGMIKSCLILQSGWNVFGWNGWHQKDKTCVDDAVHTFPAMKLTPYSCSIIQGIT
jgi:hypothetical protein